MYYVTMTDSFMSGWGMAAGKINKFIIECDSLKEAEHILELAKKRPEMKYVNIRCSKPHYNSLTVLASWRKASDIHWK